MANKWIKKLQELDGAVSRDYDPYAHVIRSPSPSLNFTFGNTHGLPLGYALIMWGPKKGGKSVLCNAFIGQLHQDDPEAIVVKYNTEYRERVQLTDLQTKNWGIDLDRYAAFETNRPENIFDKIENDISAMCEAGAKIKLIVIDSITDIAGRRSLNADTVSTQQMGDEAATVQTGLKRIRDTLRKHNIALIMTAHERAEFDPIEQMRGKKTKMAGASYLKHFAEYFLHVAPNESKEGKSDFSGVKLVNEGLLDLNDNPEIVAYRAKITMKESSVGPKGRMGELTYNFYKGIVNTHEEVFRLGDKRGVFKRPNNRVYILENWPDSGKETKWDGKPAALAALQSNEEVKKEVMLRVRKQDIELMQHGYTEANPVSEFNLEAELDTSSEEEDIE